jgi:hypothetical protein
VQTQSIFSGCLGDVVSGDRVVCGARRVVVVLDVVSGDGVVCLARRVVVVLDVVSGDRVVCLARLVVVVVVVLVVVVSRETTSQVFADIAPTVVVNLPVSQFVHVAVPLTVLYFPAPHAMHVPPLGPVNPRLQKQWVFCDTELQSV